MPRAVEIAYYSELLASLMVSAARAEDPQVLARIHDELAEAFTDVFALLSHDALGPRAADLAEGLLEAATRRGERLEVSP